jgi:ribosomal protein L37AE/L43A
MKKQLTTDDMMTFFAVFDCCDEKQLVSREMLEKHNEITCRECDEPAMFRGRNGLWYTVSGRLFP